MTRNRGAVLAALPLLLLLSACARSGAAGTSAGTSAGPVLERGSATPYPSSDVVVLRVESRGGFVPPHFLVGRLPQISVYADGRLITEGPVALSYPGPALPNLQVQQLTPEQVQQLTADAVKAGVTDGADFGTPNVADIPSTKVTVRTASGDESVEVVALREARPDDTSLTAAQHAARKKLTDFLDTVDGLATASQERYLPTGLVAIAQPWVDPGDGLGGEPVQWPGPDLPGEALNETVGTHCVAMTGEQKDTVWAAADKASQRTSWMSAGKQWSVVFRPLLPGESGCASLRNAE
ncbi:MULTISPECIES: hypothetical protein [Actinoplanes]|uniref:hypothetical protein n=1 Tax=Actinoplanes TaxID=1865 RepID=UPI0005F27A48|nr:MULTISPECIES: hypothetical protein [Actinoplanes]GLY00305.1 hypothetical protein Acsp01_06840 [Actinoplanes sp. NBRC 101535]